MKKLKKSYPYVHTLSLASKECKRLLWFPQLSTKCENKREKKTNQLFYLIRRKSADIGFFSQLRIKDHSGALLGFLEDEFNICICKCARVDGIRFNMYINTTYYKYETWWFHFILFQPWWVQWTRWPRVLNQYFRKNKIIMSWFILGTSWLFVFSWNIFSGSYAVWNEF